MPTEKESDSLLLFLHYWRIIFARKRIVIAVLVLSVLAGYVVSRLMPRVYQASCLIQVQPERPDIDPFSRAKPVQFDENLLRTQFELIQSDQVVEEVVRELNLTESLGREYGYPEDIDESKAFDRTVKLVSGKIKVRQRKSTNLIEISVEIDRPKKPKGQAAVLAARIANTVGEVFKEQTRRQSSETTRRALDELQREIKLLEKQIVEREHRLDLVREQCNIRDVDVSGGGVLNRQAIRQAKAARSKAEIGLRKKRFLLEQVIVLREQNAIRALAILVRNTTLNALVTEWSKLEIQHRAQLNSSLGPEHPRMKRLRARINELGNKIAEEIEAVCIGLRADYDAARTSYNHLTELVAKLKNQNNVKSNRGYREFRDLTRELQALHQRRNTWEESYIRERLKLQLPHTSVNIVQKAKLNQASAPISPNVSIIMIAGVMFGLMAGIGIVLLMELLNTTVKTVEDVKHHLKTQILGVIPQKVRYLNDPKMYAIHSEPYRVLRANIKSTKQSQEGWSLCVTSAGVGEGKSQTLFNLAYVCARLGDRVLIVDSDLHHPNQHKILNVDSHPGLRNFLAGEAPLADVIRNTSLPNLDLLPAGTPWEESVQGLHDTDMMMTAIRDLKRRYEWILFDSPPMVGMSDASELVRLSDAVVLVVQHRKYPRTMVQQVREMIDNLGGNLLGVVMNNINFSRGDSNAQYHFNCYPQGGKAAKSRIKLWPEKNFKRGIGA